MNVRKFPRSLEEAFGPYQRGGLVEEQDPMPVADRIVIAISAVAAVAVGAMILAGWIQ